MSSETNGQFIREYFDTLSGRAKTSELVERFVADEELKHHIALFEDAFPEYELEIDDLVAEDDRVAVRATLRGTHRRELMGIAPTDREVTIGAMLIYRIADDKIVEHWMNADTMSLMQQLGAIPAPA